MYESIIELYARNVFEGKRKLENVPAMIKERVTARVAELEAEAEANKGE